MKTGAGNLHFIYNFWCVWLQDHQLFVTSSLFFSSLRKPMSKISSSGEVVSTRSRRGSHTSPGSDPRSEMLLLFSISRRKTMQVWKSNLYPLPVDAVKLEVVCRRFGRVTAAANQGVHSLPLLLTRLCILKAKIQNMFAFNSRANKTYHRNFFERNFREILRVRPYLYETRLTESQNQCLFTFFRL